MNHMKSHIRLVKKSAFLAQEQEREKLSREKAANCQSQVAGIVTLGVMVRAKIKERESSQSMARAQWKTMWKEQW